MKLALVHKNNVELIKKNSHKGLFLRVGKNKVELYFNYESYFNLILLTKIEILWGFVPAIARHSRFWGSHSGALRLSMRKALTYLVEGLVVLAY